VTLKRPVRVAALVSGRGTNLDALVASQLPAQWVGVFSSRPEVPALEVARSYGIPVASRRIPPGPPKPADDHALRQQLSAWQADWVVLAGYMRMIGPEVLGAFEGRIVNIHPSLLPAFPGLHPQQQAIEAGATVTGASVHFVVPGPVDGGAVIDQERVPVLPSDTEDVLSARILAVEHVLYARALRSLWSPVGA
jgi:phosphoribosylglycinamide formyltransferase-1